MMQSLKYQSGCKDVGISKIKVEGKCLVLFDRNNVKNSILKFKLYTFILVYKPGMFSVLRKVFINDIKYLTDLNKSIYFNICILCIYIFKYLYASSINKFQYWCT